MSIHELVDAIEAVQQFDADAGPCNIVGDHACNQTHHAGPIVPRPYVWTLSYEARADLRQMCKENDELEFTIDRSAWHDPQIGDTIAIKFKLVNGHEYVAFDGVITGLIALTDPSSVRVCLSRRLA